MSMSTLRTSGSGASLSTACVPLPVSRVVSSTAV
jgi:hypothetical protein